MSVEMIEAASLGPAARNVERTTEYHHRRDVSRRERLSQAADVLCLVSFFALGHEAHVDFTALLERRLVRAYEEIC